MANRICPVCGKTIPATLVMSMSDGLDCPHCGSRLEVASGSRMVPTFAGLIVAYLVWNFTSGSQGLLSWALPELYAVLAFGIVTPLLLVLTARLNPAPAPPPVAAAPAAAHGHH